MTKTTCDICGKDMPTSVFTDSITELNFCISSYGVKWDICNECREEFNKWMNGRAESEDKE